MARSLSLAAYRAYVKRGPVPDYTPVRARPKGELVWAHATSPTRLVALVDLTGRLAAQRGAITILITYDPALVSQKRIDKLTISQKELITEALPADHPATVARFLDHWAPDVCLWTGGFLRPNMVLNAADRKVPLFLIDASENGFDSRKERWFPEVTRQLLKCFSVIMAQSDTARQRLLKIGLNPKSVELTPLLRPGGQALPCNMDELDDLANQLAGRPIWLAADVQPDEVDLVLQAHRTAARLAHRLLLILVSATPNEKLADRVASQGLRVSNWAHGNAADELTQVLVVDSPDDLGLWYRLAPLAFVGSSLVSGYGGRNPFVAATLGSAILYGPNVGDHLDSYSRLASAGAARIVKDADGLGTSVLRLIAPDLAASMAHAGWEIVSEGAELTDRVVDLMQDALDAETSQ